VASQQHAPFGRLPAPVANSITVTLGRIVSVLRPYEGIYDVDVSDRTLATMLRFVPHMAGPVRVGFPLGLLLIEFGAPLFGFGLTRFRSMKRARAISYLERIGRGAEPFRMLFDGLRVLVLLSFYQQPEIMAALDVSWAPRAEELIARRAKLMNMEPALANPRNAGDAQPLGALDDEPGGTS
jgi:hypothetical protein